MIWVDQSVGINLFSPALGFFVKDTLLDENTYGTEFSDLAQNGQIHGTKY